MRRRWVRWLALGVSLTFTFRLAGNVYRLVKSGERVGRTQRELAEAQEENRKLKERLEYVKSEEFVEKEARERLGLGKPGEVVLIMPTTSPMPANDQKQEENWRRWWELYIRI